MTLHNVELSQVVLIPVLNPTGHKYSPLLVGWIYKFHGKMQ